MTNMMTNLMTGAVVGPDSVPTHMLTTSIVRSALVLVVVKMLKRVCCPPTHLVCEEDCGEAIFLNGVVRQELEAETVAFARDYLCCSDDHDSVGGGGG